MSAEIKVDLSDVIKLLLQFCAENNLDKTFEALQTESKVSLNTVPNLETFQNDIQQGCWDAVLKAVGHMTLPISKLYDLYEQIVVEMVELREIDVALRLLRDSEVLQSMQTTHPERYARLEHLTTKTFFDIRDAYPDGMTKEKKRAMLANALSAEVTIVPPARLLTLLGHALKWQQYQGILPPGNQFDLFRGSAQKKVDDYETYPTHLHRTIKFGAKSNPETAVFSPNGAYFITGSVDGFVEVWDYETAKLRKDLEYQREDSCMMHDESVLCAAFSSDSQLLATGSQEGMVKIWNISTGQCLRKLERAHTKGITSVAFSRDSTQILSGSYDATARLHGLKSGKMLKEFRGHTSYVNDVCFSHDGTRIFTASSDGTCKIWDVKGMECLYTITPPTPFGGDAPVVNKVVPIPRTTDHYLLCSRIPSVHVIDSTGKVLKTMHSGKKAGGNFLNASVSPKGEWAYCVGEDSILYCFYIPSGKLESTLKLSDSDVIGLAHHPHRNYLCSYSVDGSVKFWVPK